MDDKKIWGWIGAIAALIGVAILYFNYKNTKEHTKIQAELAKSQKELTELQKNILKNGGKV